MLALGAVVLLGACGGGGDDNDDGQPAQLAPSVTLGLQPTTILLGQSATLTWSADAGATCAAADGWSGSQAASGSQNLTPTVAGSINYTLTCTASGASTTRTVTLTVNAPSAVANTTLTSDIPGAANLDANLKNPWGIAFGPTSPVWIANNVTDTSTLYDGLGAAAPSSAPLVVQLPSEFGPTGIVFNPTAAFVTASGGASAPARFIFAGESGQLAAWAPQVDLDNALIVYTDTGGAYYTGLALAADAGQPLLYAADFRNGRIDVFDSAFNKQAADAFAFTDPTLPAEYAPFNVQALPTGASGVLQLYVAYAQRQLTPNVEELTGAGLGLVNVFDTRGQFVKRLVTNGGPLDAPWGFALAPADFGTFSNAVLVGNFGDGRIHAFEAGSGAHLGALADASGNAFSAPGLWGIAFGNDHDNQPHAALFYAAGANGEQNGVYGRLDPGATAPNLHAPPTVALTAPTNGSTVSASIAVSADASGSAPIASVEFFANGASLGVVTTAPFTVQWDTTQVPNGPVSLTARAIDVDSNVDTSAAVSVSVDNTVAAAPTLTELQAQIFTPLCSGCHNGASPPGGPLPGSQNLTAGATFANVVNVPSLQQPMVLRVKPGDPDNSYLVQKLEGAATISGSRMPLGGPFLDQATIDQVRAWIAAGAPND